jgi:hypothetical protein
MRRHFELQARSASAGLRGDNLTDGLLQQGSIRTSAESLDAFRADALGRGAR